MPPSPFCVPTSIETRKESSVRRTAIAMRSQRGFTLIELLIIVIILGILAAIVVVAVGRTRSDAAVSACKTAVSSVQLAAEVYNTRVGHYPDTQADVLSADAMLKDWPSSDYYSLAYVPSGYSAGPPVVHASGYTVTVEDANGAPVASCSDL